MVTHPAGLLFCLLHLINICSAIPSLANPHNASAPIDPFSRALDVAFSARRSKTISVNINSTTSVSSEDPPIHVRCFKNPAPPAPLLHSFVVMADYCKALQQIILRPDFLEITIWDLNPDSTTWFGWTSHDSGIFLGGHVSTVEAFAPAFVVHVAAVIAAECVSIDKGYLGGIANAGPEGNILVAVGAKNYEQPSASTARS